MTATQFNANLHRILQTREVILCVANLIDVAVESAAPAVHASLIYAVVSVVADLDADK